jgi:hypothetical protein
MEQQTSEGEGQGRGAILGNARVAEEIARRISLGRFLRERGGPRGQRSQAVLQNVLIAEEVLRSGALFAYVDRDGRWEMVFDRGTMEQVIDRISGHTGSSKVAARGCTEVAKKSDFGRHPPVASFLLFLPMRGLCLETQLLDQVEAHLTDSELARTRLGTQYEYYADHRVVARPMYSWGLLENALQRKGVPYKPER